MFCYSKMDPYITIETRMQKLKTKTMQGAGKTPKWDQMFDIDVKYIGDDMKVQCWDEDVTSSDLIGETTIKLSALCVNGGLDEWYNISFKGKQSGSVHLKGQWTPAKQGGAGGHAQVQPQQMGQNAAMGMFGVQPMGMGMQ